MFSCKACAVSPLPTIFCFLDLLHGLDGELCASAITDISSLVGNLYVVRIDAAPIPTFMV